MKDRELLILSVVLVAAMAGGVGYALYKLWPFIGQAKELAAKAQATAEVVEENKPLIDMANSIAGRLGF